MISQNYFANDEKWNHKKNRKWKYKVFKIQSVKCNEIQNRKGGEGK